MTFGPIIDFILGCIIGAGVVSSSVHRTIMVDKGSVQGAFSGSLLNSITYWFSVTYIAHGNNVAYCGTALGSTIAVCYMAYKQKQKGT